MRSRYTNVLQSVVLITGIVYIICGLIFYFSPVTIIKLFSQIPLDGWLNMVKGHAFVEPMYYLLRCFSALVFSVGCAMVLPLFDPLKYRGLIYFTNIIFPSMASLLLLKNAIQQGFKYWELAGLKGTTDEHSGPVLIVVFGVSFLVIAIINGIGLKITAKRAKEGLE